MTSELVVDVQPKEVSIALLEDKQLVELQSEGRNISFSVGNMYLGRVKKLMPGLNACFVDVGYEKDAFLHYLDLGPQFNSLEKYVKQTLSDKKKLNPITKATILPDLEKDGTVSNTLKVGQEVVVQIVKEPISTKGPRLTSELSFAGRYLVLIPSQIFQISADFPFHEPGKRIEPAKSTYNLTDKYINGMPLVGMSLFVG